MYITARVRGWWRRGCAATRVASGARGDMFTGVYSGADKKMPLRYEQQPDTVYDAAGAAPAHVRGEQSNAVARPRYAARRMLPPVTASRQRAAPATDEAAMIAMSVARHNIMARWRR